MKRHWMPIAAALMALFSMIPATQAQEKPLRWGYSAAPFPPFTSKSASGEWTGFDVDIMNAMCRQMQARCEIAEVAWDGIIPALQANKIDVIWSGMSMTAEREKVVDFTDRYRRGPGAFVAEKASPIVVTAEGLRGKSVGVSKATNYQRYLEAYYGKTARVKLYDSLDDSTADLAAGRIDAVLGDILQLKIFLKTPEGAPFDIKAVTPVDPILGRGAGAGIRKGDDALRLKLNAAISAIRASGEYDAIAKRYFDFDPYGT